jgi:hypothetical protein
MGRLSHSKASGANPNGVVVHDRGEEHLRIGSFPELASLRRLSTRPEGVLLLPLRQGRRLTYDIAPVERPPDPSPSQSPL